MTTVVLASASPARLQTLRNAGIDPTVQVSHVDEESLQASMPDATPAQIAQALAQAKCEKVVTLRGNPNELIIGCDSVFELGGKPYGKPESAEVARMRWRDMMNTTGTLHTGHFVTFIDSQGNAHQAQATASTDVHLGSMSEREIGAYLASGEPLAVAGGFTLDALGGAFVESITGDPSNVVGISLPTLRKLVTQLGLTWTDLWNNIPASASAPKT